MLNRNEVTPCVMPNQRTGLYRIAAFALLMSAPGIFSGEFHSQQQPQPENSLATPVREATLPALVAIKKYMTII
ncbi:MAG: hypothetical protein NVSMB58_35030 [Terriglobales bacterium]